MLPHSCDSTLWSLSQGKRKFLLLLPTWLCSFDLWWVAPISIECKFRSAFQLHNTLSLFWWVKPSRTLLTMNPRSGTVQAAVQILSWEQTQTGVGIFCQGLQAHVVLHRQHRWEVSQRSRSSLVHTTPKAMFQNRDGTLHGKRLPCSLILWYWCGCWKTCKALSSLSIVWGLTPTAMQESYRQ